MDHSANTSFYNSNFFFRLLFLLTIVTFGFVIFHQVMMLLDFFPVKWIRELHFNLQNGIPFFLFLTGSFIRNKALRIPMIFFFVSFFIGYLLNALDSWSIIDIRSLKWLIGPALLGLLITYSIHFFTKKKKVLLDYLKIFWFFLIGYIQLSVLFPVLSFQVFILFEISNYFLIALMSLGIISYLKRVE